MTRDEVNQVLRDMEQCNELILASEDEEERAQLQGNLDTMWQSIRLYVEGGKLCDDEGFA
jgi:hypothetical protein